MTIQEAVSEDTQGTTTATVTPAMPPDVPVDEADRSMSLGRRLRSPQTLISFAIAFALIFFIFRRLDIDFSAVWREVRGANPLWLVFGFAAYYGSFPIRAARWRRLLANAGIDRERGFTVPGIKGLSEIYVLSWFANCVVPAKLGDAYRGYLLKKHAGPSFSRTLGTIFAERLMDVVALVALMMLSGLIAFHGTVPDDLQWWFVAGGVLVALGIGGLLALIFFGHGIRQRLPERVRPHYERLEDGIVTSFARGRFPSIVALTVSIWMLEGIRVFAVTQALDVSLTFQACIFVALLASLLTTFPITPAGLGAVESGTIVALTLFDVGDSQAGAVALIDRGIAYWSVILFGGLLYLVSRHK